MNSRNADREEFLRKAARLYDQMMARTGPASADTFDDIEVQAEKGGKGLIRELLQDRLKTEEDAQTRKVICPRCGRRMRRPKKLSHRKLDTMAGTVAYARRHAICDRCSESFSPSGPPVEDPPQRSVRPRRPQGL